MSPSVFAQTTGSFEVAIPTPSASGLGNYDYQEVDLVNGTVSYNIPLTSIGNQHIQIPIGLKYYSKGVKVDQSFNWTGIDWKLSAGGAITRVIKGMPDEKVTGYLYTSKYIGDIDYFEKVGLRDYDPEPDKFSFSFLNYSGRFFIKLINPSSSPSLSNLKVVTAGNNNLKFEITSLSGYTIQGFKAWDKQGNIFHFTLKEYSDDQAQISNKPSAWFLTKIESPYTDDEIVIDYKSAIANSSYYFEAEYFGADTPSHVNSSTRKEDFSRTVYRSTHIPEYILSQNDSIYFNTTDLLREITVYDRDTGYPKRSFEIDYTKDTGTPPSNSLFTMISKVTFNDRLGVAVNSFEMDYYNVNSIAAAGVYEQDHWGYYNENGETDTFLPEMVIAFDQFPYSGSTIVTTIHREYADRNPNPLVVHYGMLKKVTLPAGGAIEYEYEPNEYHDVFELYLTSLRDMVTRTSSFSFSSTSCPSGYVDCRKATFTINSLKENGHVDVPSVADLDLGYSIFDGSGYESEVKLTNTTTSTVKGTYTDLGAVGLVSVELDDIMGDYLLENGTYEIQINSEASFTVLQNDITVTEEKTVTKKTGPGVRVSKVIINDGSNSRELLYDYNDSGVLISEPEYFFAVQDFNDDNDKPGDMYINKPGSSRLDMGVLSSSPISFKGDNGNAMSGYRKVTVTNESSSNGWTDYYFSGIETIDPISYTLGDPRGLKYLGSEYNSTAGKLLRKEVMNSSGQKINKTSYEYYYHFNTSPETDDKFVTNQGYSNYIFDRYNMKIFDYKDYLFWTELETKKLTTYSGSDSLVVTENYTYDTSTKNITEKESINSLTSESRIIKTTYAYDQALHNGMEALNMLSQPYSQSLEDGSGNVMSKSWTQWTSNFLISPGSKWRAYKQWVWEGSSSSDVTAPVSHTSEASLVAEVLKYDNYGNFLEVEDVNENLTKYYYGSNSSPFSQVGLNGTNGIYLTGVQKVTGTSDCNNCGTRPSVGSPDDLFINAEYDTYGRMTDVTDENEFTMTYNYDYYGRLTNVYNQNGELVQTNSYYYSLENNTNYSSSDPNRVESWTHYDPANPSNITKSVSYMDGLGRNLQNQVRGGSTTIITDTRYNERGLPEVTSRPYQIANQTTYKQYGFEGDSLGIFVPGSALPSNSSIEDEYQSLPSDDEDYAYSQVQYEASPLARTQKSTLPGPSHKMGSGKEMEMSYGLNTTESFTINGKTWAANTLNKTVSRDPEGNETITYTDGWGQTIVSGTNMNPASDDVLNKSSSDLVTYFEYDLKGNLVRVEDPRGLATTYSYNQKGELTSKKLPDQEYSVDYKYDEKGRLRFVHDPNHKSQENDLSTNLSGNNTVTKTLVVTSKGVLSYSILIYDLYMAGYDVEIKHVENGNSVIHSNSASSDDELTGSIVVDPGTYVFYGNTQDPGEPIAGTSGSYSFSSYDIYTYTKYDELDRPIETGEYAGSTSFSSADPDTDTFPSSGNEANIQYYYDGDQAYSGSLTPQNMQGRISKVSYRDLSVSTTTWGHTYYSYNSLGLVEWVVQDLPGLSVKKIEYDYDELGRLTQMDYQAGVSGEEFYQRYTYDALGRMNKVETSTNGSTWIKDAEYTSFLADGQVGQLKLGNTDIQTVDYSYTVQGWLEKINNPSSIGSDEFAMYLDYNLNGNISQQQWRQPELNGNLAMYDYSYDAANRLTAANFSGSGYSSSAFDVTGIKYDKNGGLKEIFRRGNTSSLIAELDIQIDNESNQIDVIDDYVALEQWGVSYDANGNMISNDMKGFSSVDYDWRNLPAQMIIGANTLQYAYDAEGNRVKKKMGSTETHYVRGARGETIAIYQADTLLSHNILAGSEIVGNHKNEYRKYFLKDHLGSVRTTVDQSGNVDGYDDYYPFGLVMPGRSSNSANPNDTYKFTGHEQDEEVGINLIHMNARSYDPAIARFMQVDPMMEFASPYVYVGNNPLNFTDPTGMYSQGIAVRFDYDDDGNEYVVLEPGDTIFDVIDFIRDNNLQGVNFEEGAFDENGYAIPGARGSTGRTVLDNVKTGYPGQGLPWWINPGPGKVKSIKRLSKSGAAFNGFLALIKGRKATLTVGKLYHIMKNHGFGRGASWKGKFLPNTDLATLESMIQKTVARAKKLPNTRGRPGNTFIYDFGKTIGTSGGKNVTKLKVVVINGKVRTAFPVK